MLKSIKLNLLRSVQPETPVSIKNAVIVLSMLILSGCHSLGVEPWQRDNLSRPDMQFGTADLQQTLGQHFYFSRESSSGGLGFAGGGCGCN